MINIIEENNMIARLSQLGKPPCLGAQSGEAPKISADVVISKHSISPLRVTIAPGSKLRMINVAGVPYTVVSTGMDGEQAFIRPGRAAQFLFEKPGRYTLSCLRHPHLKTDVVVK